MNVDLKKLKILKKLFGKNLFIWLGAALLIAIIGLLAYSLILKNFISPKIDPSVGDDKNKLVKQEVIQLEILNGSGEKGAAQIVRGYLRARGFDVVEIKNADTIYQKSNIYDRIGDLSSSKKIAQALLINEGFITEKIDSNLFLRASVIIGKDYKELAPFK